MKRIYKFLSCAICLIMMISLFSGCHSDDERIDFIYPFKGDITSFDPQIASTGDEFLVIENCFEGLIRITDNGDILPGVAESWNISGDGLTYTFKLRQGAKWRIKEKSAVKELMGEDFNPDITADDFVFALRRACDPNTESSLFSSIASIVNAADIHSGSKNTDQLGVIANDNYTLTIKLQSADNGFLNTLSTAVAMPCNEEYFNATKGRYGLGLDYTMFNGQFYVSTVLDTSYILKSNDLYVGEHPSKVTDITLSIINEETDIPKNLKNGYYDAAYISGNEYEALGDNKITVTPYSNKMWAMVLNQNRQLFRNSDLRQAVCLSISNIDTQEHTYLSQATGLTPPSCIIDNNTADKMIGTTVPSQNTEKAVELWRDGLVKEKFTTADLTVITTKEMEEITKHLVQGIQGSIGQISSYGKNASIAFSLKIEALETEDYSKRLSDGDYDIALCCFEAASHNPVTFLADILNSNYAGEISSAGQAIENAQHVAAKELPAACKTAEEEIINSWSLLPVLYESSYYAQAKGVSGIDFHPGSGRVSFINATREK